MPIPHEAFYFEGDFSFTISSRRGGGTAVMTDETVAKVQLAIRREVQELLDSKVARAWELTGHNPGELCTGVREVTCHRIIANGDSDWPGPPRGSARD